MIANIQHVPRTSFCLVSDVLFTLVAKAVYLSRPGFNGLISQVYEQDHVWASASSLLQSVVSYAFSLTKAGELADAQYFVMLIVRNLLTER